MLLLVVVYKFEAGQRVYEVLHDDGKFLDLASCVFELDLKVLDLIN